MDLTAWQKICHRILGKAFKKKARNDTKLSEDLVKGNMPIMPEVYMAQLFVTTVAVTIICGILLAAIFMPDIGLIAWYESRPDLDYALACYEWEYWNADLVDETLESRGCPYFQYMEFPVFAKLLIPIILGFVVPFGTYKYLKGSAARSAHARGVALEKYLPYAASYTAAMAAANATPHKIFKSLALNGDIYGEIAYDSAMIYRDVSLLGYDLLTAMKMAVDRAASPWMTEFFQGMVGTLTAGGSLKLYFLNRAEHYMRENRTRLQEFLESLAMLAESYVVVAVAMPLFLIVMLVIMFWVSGAGAQMEESTLYAVVLLVLPMIHAMFAFIVWSSSEEQKM
tara:strand:- start:908 stop:1927 length:1020 start_codon:yes stop_codon:yes gene_type:complete